MARTENVEPASARSTRLATSVGLSLLFLILYPLCNWLAARRGYVPMLFFEWERAIPFVPLMIVPYMSLDLLFVAAPFLCRTNAELASLSKRIAGALIAAGVCFVLFPFRFAFDRPHAAGWLGAIFDWFQGLDRPFNLLPSLHIAFCTILGHFYARRTRGLLRQALLLWFVLIGFSAVLTYQHHLMDVVGGFALGAYCLYFFPESAPRLPSGQNHRVASYYFTGTLAVGSLVCLSWPWGALLLWPAIALAIVTAAYLGAGPGVFRKSNGRLPGTTFWTLGPVLVGQHISRLFYRRQSPAWNELTPRLRIGGVLTRNEASELIRQGVTAVLDLSAEFSEAKPFLNVVYKNIPTLELTAPTVAQLEEMISFIERESETGIVYLHCKIGYSRTAVLAAAYLLSIGAASSISEAIESVRRVRPRVVIRPEVLEALRQFRDLSSRRVDCRSHNAAAL